MAARPAEPWLAAFRALLPRPWPTLGGNVNLAAFDRLTSAVPTDRIEAPQRVSVVVTSYRPGEGLITAVRSILAQSWRNVEVVIVDDGSPAEFDEMLQRALALGERIRLVRQPANLGTYAARNAGLDASGGEFVAFQDSDDWSHPRRLELQVAPLLAEKRLVATTSDGMSVTDDLLLTRPGVRSGRFNPSSLVFRRTVVMGRIGYFDRVRKAADSEYIGRMQAAFGARIGAARGRRRAGADPVVRELVVPGRDPGALDAPGAGRVQLGVPALAPDDRGGGGEAVPAGGRR